MRPLAGGTLLLSLATLVLAGDAASDQKGLQGKWKIVAFQSRGEDASKKAVALQVAFAGDMMTIQEAASGKKINQYQIRLDPKSKPASIDLERVTPTGKARQVKGIYKLEGDRLTICLNDTPNGDRPTEFASPAKTRVDLVVLERAK